MRSLKTKLILAISVFVIFLFSVTAILLISEKERELTRDIYRKGRSFAELTTPKIVDLSSTYLAEGGSVIFQRELKDIFKKNEDVAAISIANFAGELLYDSKVEADRAYEGGERTIPDTTLLKRIKASHPSILVSGSGRLVFLKKDVEGDIIAVNEREQEIPDITDTERIVDIVYPHENRFAVIFDVTYANLQARVARTIERILYLLAFGILLGLGLGYLFSSRITVPIQKLTKSALVLARGNFRERVKVTVKDEVGTLAETFNKMAHDLEISTKALVYKERVAKELEVAARIQKEILPSAMPKIPGLDIAAGLIPAAEIGGDCYDFIPLDHDEKYLLYISDVTGHGVPSGIVVSIANALLYSYAHLPHLKQILEHTNAVLKEKTANNMFMTLLMLRWGNGKMEYISAGHPEMLHYYGSEKKVTTEKGGGIALGMVPSISNLIQEQELHVASGDVLVLYSDGIPEAISKRKEMYGLQRFRRALNEHGDLPSAEAIRTALLADVEEFLEGEKPADDVTLVVIKRR